MTIKLAFAASIALGTVAIVGGLHHSQPPVVCSADKDDAPHLYHCSFLLGNSTERFSLDVTAKDDAEAIKKVKGVHASAKSIILTRGARA